MITDHRFRLDALQFAFVRVHSRFSNNPQLTTSNLIGPNHAFQLAKYLELG